MEEGLPLQVSADCGKRPHDNEHPASEPTPGGTCHFDDARMKILVPVILILAGNKRGYRVCKQWLQIQLEDVFPPGRQGKDDKDPQHFGQSLCHTLERGHMEYYHEWSAKSGGWSPSASGNAFLHEMLRRGRADVVQRLLEISVVVHEVQQRQRENDRESLLLLNDAVVGGSAPAMELLLPHLDVANGGAHALQEAGWLGRLEIAKLLLAHGVQPTIGTLLWAFACMPDRFHSASDMVSCLFRHGGLVDSPAKGQAIPNIVICGLVEHLAGEHPEDIVELVNAFRHHPRDALLTMGHIRDAVAQAHITVRVSSDGGYKNDYGESTS